MHGLALISRFIVAINLRVSISLEFGYVGRPTRYSRSIRLATVNSERGSAATIRSRDSMRCCSSNGNGSTATTARRRQHDVAMATRRQCGEKSMFSLRYVQMNPILLLLLLLLLTHRRNISNTSLHCRPAVSANMSNRVLQDIDKLILIIYNNITYNSYILYCP